MNTATAAMPVTETIQADLNYAIETGVKPVNETFGPDNIQRRRSGAVEAKRMTIRNGRPLAKTFSLEVNGFEFVDHSTKMVYFFDKDELARVYYPETVELVKKVSGAQRVMVFDHTLRSGDLEEREAKRVREPVLSVHNDYTEWSGPQRVREILPDEAEQLLTRRFAVIQVWRAINQPIQSNPLAIADARSLAPADLLAAERRYPHRVGETYQVKHNANHQWYYFPRMRRDEALVFKVYESLKDGRARFTAHSAFEDPNTPAGAPPRQSIEIRTLAFF
ncbi:MAG: methyltransferase [Betaproteobacteria bacterium]|nr:methyltransferase [Betaproteobacteria bacterium]